MTVKEIWTEADFAEMGWHDSQLYAIHFPRMDTVLKLDIDYIFEWVLDEANKRFSFWVAPCTLCFRGVITLKVDLDFDHQVGLEILDIERFDPVPYPDGQVIDWTYKISTSNGDITFASTGYEQLVRRQPVFQDGQSLEGEDRG